MSSEALALLQHLMQPEPEHDPVAWDALLAEVDQGRSPE